MSRKILTLFAVLAAFSCATGSCARKEILDIPQEPPGEPEKKDPIMIQGKTYPIRQLLYDIEFREFSETLHEDGISVRILADGAGISADIPVSAMGRRIDLSSRDPNPGPGDLFYTFYVSVDQDEGEYGRLYVRVLSWDMEPNPYRGWFSIDRYGDDSELTVEWELSGDNGKTPLSDGHIKSAFEPIANK
jgi:hypothetical protein